MPSLKSIFLLLLLVCCFSPVEGQQSRDKGEAVWRILEKYDGDGDGVVTRQEYPRSERSFSSYDLDSDLRLTAEEIAQWVEIRGNRGGRRERRPQGRQGGRSGGRGPARVVIALADENGDGSVDRQEWQRALAGLPVLEESISAAVLVEKLSGGSVRRFAEMFTSRLDEDGDGKILLSEIEDLFRHADGDGDGKVIAVDSSGGDRSRRERPGFSRGRGGEEREAGGTPAVGDTAPDFDLPISGKLDSRIRLSSYSGDKPVALIFGSYT